MAPFDIEPVILDRLTSPGADNSTAGAAALRAELQATFACQLSQPVASAADLDALAPAERSLALSLGVLPRPLVPVFGKIAGSGARKSTWRRCCTKATKLFFLAAARRSTLHGRQVFPRAFCLSSFAAK